MAAHPHNRPHRVDATAGKFLYALYELLFSADVALRVKQRTFETAAESKDSWRVVSISRAALEQINDRKSAKDLRRGHMLSRRERAAHLFVRDAPLPQADLLSYFFDHDTVALVTKSENARHGCCHWSELLAVPAGLFTAGSFSIYVRQPELAWVAQQMHVGVA
jgi:hypothetical protein